MTVPRPLEIPASLKLGDGTELPAVARLVDIDDEGTADYEVTDPTGAPIDIPESGLLGMSLDLLPRPLPGLRPLGRHRRGELHAVTGCLSCDDPGYVLVHRHLPAGRVVDVEPLLYGRARLHLGPDGSGFYSDSY
ncbi:MAG: hypothetical protein ACRDYV_00005 [Acidimicrobiia bacterium]